MTDPLAAAFAQTDSGLFYPAQARREVFPWDDLQAVSPPTGYTNIIHELVATLAIAVGQGPTVPRLIRATDQGELFTVSRPNIVTTLTAPVVDTDRTLQVLDSTGIFIGQTLVLISATGANTGCGGIAVRGVPDSTHINVVSLCTGLSFLPGDYVVAVPSTTISGVALAKLTSFDELQTWPGGTAPPGNELSATVDPVGRLLLRTDATRPYDLWLWSQLQINAAASVTFAAPGAGRRLQLAYVSAASWSTGAGSIDQLQVWKNGIGVGTQLFETMLSPPAANTGDRYQDESIRLVGDDNGTLSVTLNLVSATLRHEVQAGVFILKQ